MSFFGWKGSNARAETGEHAGRNLQDGLFQIASQACHILVQVNNTRNVSYGGSNTVRNIAYSKCSGKEEEPGETGPARRSASKDRDAVVVLPRRKSRTPPLAKQKLSTVSENDRLEPSPPSRGIAVGTCIPDDDDDDYELWDRSGFAVRGEPDDPSTNGKWGGALGWCRPSCIPITIILILIVLVVLLPLLDHAADKHGPDEASLRVDSSCADSCDFSLVETIPIGMSYPNDSFLLDDTYSSWIKLISLAREKIEIASFYWTMRREDVYPDESARQGEEVFRMLVSAGRERNIELRVAQNAPSQVRPNIDTEILAKKANAKVRSVNFAALLGGGVLHTKLWLVDRTHLYVGSANMDWRSLAQVKELGLLALNCTCLARDYAKIFDVYWIAADAGKLPAVWPDSLATGINLKQPLPVASAADRYGAFVASSPPAFSPKGRTSDADAILACIERAEKFIHIAVMDYFPLTVFTPKIKYWPVIDDALRTAAIERKVRVRLLVSWWKHSARAELSFLRSLVDLSGSYAGASIETRIFVVPSTPDQERIPFSRVNHNKYMVTDSAAYIGTSNWSGDYFTNTAGIGTVFESVGAETPDNLRRQLENVFDRDWNSEYSRDLNESFAFARPRSTASWNGIDADYYPLAARYPSA